MVDRRLRVAVRIPAITDEAQVRVSYAGSTVTDASDAENALALMIPAFDDSALLMMINGTVTLDFVHPAYR